MLADEINALTREEVNFVQLDAPGNAVFMDYRHQQRVVESGVDLEKLLAEAIAADNT